MNYVSQVMFHGPDAPQLRTLCDLAGPKSRGNITRKVNSQVTKGQNPAWTAHRQATAGQNSNHLCKVCKSDFSNSQLPYVDLCLYSFALQNRGYKLTIIVVGSVPIKLRPCVT